MPKETTKKVITEFRIQKEMERNSIRLWILRILVDLDGNLKFLNKWGFESAEIAKFLGLNSFLEGEYQIAAARKDIHSLYRQYKKNRLGHALPVNSITGRNIDRLARCFGLSHTEKAILHFTIFVKTNMLLNECIEMLGMTRPSLIPRIFSCCLHLNLERVNKALSPESMLCKSGILNLEPDAYGVDMKLNLLPGLIDAIDMPECDLIKMFQSSFYPSQGPRLEPKDYPHLQQDIELLGSYLQHALRSKRKGVNILIYGPPGTGKSEFARMMAKATNSCLYEIGSESKSGSPLSRSQRFRAFRTAQNLFSRHRNHLILFDEVEDVFDQPEDGIYKKGNASGQKAWVNKILEENGVPAFWLTNNVHGLDGAYIRRFDFVINMDIPPKAVRQTILNTYLEGLAVSESCKQQLSAIEKLSPATVERASSILRVMGRLPLNMDAAFHRLIGNTIEAMGNSRPILKNNEITLDYSVDVLNSDCDIESISRGIAKAGSGRICLYGPPGTGKSAFGRYIADLCDRPLIVKRASDIISSWLGETEKNMARMFGEAKDMGAVLVLDEADTYLQDRKHLKQSWEISTVNEMLTQIEAFDGIFLCSTNLMDSLDVAALRRFDLKIKFDYLSASHSKKLFIRCATRLGLECDEHALKRLDQMKLLTPGDFATVLRQSRLRPVKGTDDFVARLEAECQLKPEGNKRTIGFH